MALDGSGRPRDTLAHCPGKQNGNRWKNLLYLFQAELGLAREMQTDLFRNGMPANKSVEKLTSFNSNGACIHQHWPVDELLRATTVSQTPNPVPAVRIAHALVQFSDQERRCRAKDRRKLIV